MKSRIATTLVLLLAVMVGGVNAQSKVLMFDMSHGQTEVPGLNLLERYEKIAGDAGATLKINRVEITPAVLEGVTALIVMTPFRPPQPPAVFTPVEQDAIVEFVKRGGRALVVAEEERRMDPEAAGLNDIVRPFGMEFGEDTPVRNNVGSIALLGEISQGRRELPYSGGRILNGGIALSIVNDEGGYQHMAYAKLENGGRIIAAGDAMVLFFLGSAEGVRLSGPGGARGDAVVGAGAPRGAGPGGAEPPATPAVGPPAAPAAGPGGSGGPGFALATMFWGKDSVPFVEDVVAWLLQ